MRPKSRSQRAGRIKLSRGQHQALLARLAVSVSVVPFFRRYRGSGIFDVAYFMLTFVDNFCSFSDLLTFQLLDGKTFKCEALSRYLKGSGTWINVDW